MIKKQKDESYLYEWNRQLRKEQEILKIQVKKYKDLIDKKEIERTNLENQFNFIVPQNIDTSSLMIFLEEYALLNDVTVSKIDLHKDKDNRIFIRLGIAYKPVSVEAVGSYENIMRFISDIQNNVGVANYIDNLVVQGIDANVISMNEQDEQDNNVVVSFQIYLGYSGKEGEQIE